MHLHPLKHHRRAAFLAVALVGITVAGNPSAAFAGGRTAMTSTPSYAAMPSAPWPYPSGSPSGPLSSERYAPNVAPCGAISAATVAADLGYPTMAYPSTKYGVCSYISNKRFSATYGNIQIIVAPQSATSQELSFTAKTGGVALTGVGDFAFTRTFGSEFLLGAVRGNAGVLVTGYGNDPKAILKAAKRAATAMLAYELKLKVPYVAPPGITRPYVGYVPAPGNPTGSVSLNLVDTCGLNIPGLLLRVWRDGTPDVWSDQFSAVKGPSVFRDVPVGKYSATISWLDGAIVPSPYGIDYRYYFTVTKGQTATWQNPGARGACPLPNPPTKLPRTTTVTGIVTDVNDNPVPGVFIAISVAGVIYTDTMLTDASGRYTFKAPAGTAVLSLGPAPKEYFIIINPVPRPLTLITGQSYEQNYLRFLRAY